jgi:hypothetical protein
MPTTYYKCDWCDYESTNEYATISHEGLCACNPINHPNQLSYEKDN